MQVVLDTDVVVAGLRSRHGASRLRLRAVRRGEADLPLTAPLVIEYEAVLLRPETLSAVRGTPQGVSRFLDQLCVVARLVEVSFLCRPTLRDPDDEMVLEAAVNGRADRLLTFNLRDFAGSERLGVRVARPGPTWREWRGGGP